MQYWREGHEEMVALRCLASQKERPAQGLEGCLGAPWGDRTWGRGHGGDTVRAEGRSMEQCGSSGRRGVTSCHRSSGGTCGVRRGCDCRGEWGRSWLRGDSVHTSDCIVHRQGFLSRGQLLTLGFRKITLITRRRCEREGHRQSLGRQLSCPAGAARPLGWELVCRCNTSPSAVHSLPSFSPHTDPNKECDRKE